MTTLVRGDNAAKGAEKTAADTFAAGGMGENLPTLSLGEEGMRIGAVLTALGFTTSNGEAKRKLAEGAVKLDDTPITDPGALLSLGDGEESRLSLGKKKHAILRK